MHNQHFLLQLAVNASCFQKWESKVSWCQKSRLFSQNCGVLNRLFTHSILLAFPKAQPSLGLNVPVKLKLKAMLAFWVITSEGFPSSACRTFISFYCGWANNFANWALSGPISHRKLTPAMQLLWVFIWQSNTMSSLIYCTTKLFFQLLEILFPCKVLHVSKKDLHQLWPNTSLAIVCVT